MTQQKAQLQTSILAFEIDTSLQEGRNFTENNIGMLNKQTN